MSKTILTESLEIAFEQHGERSQPPMLLLHGWPDDVRTWDKVVPSLQQAGYCLYVPSMRGCGETRFRSGVVERSGQVTALARDVAQFIEALDLQQPIVVGHDWGALMGYALAALWPEKVKRLITLEVGYEAKMKRGNELLPEQGKAYWYQWFFHTERGREALEKNPEKLCRFLWETWSPSYRASEEEFARTAKSWDNPDWVAITLHAYRFRWAGAPPYPEFGQLEARLAQSPKIDVPTLVLHGDEDGASLVDSSAGKEAFFTGPYERRVLPGVGHFSPREAPEIVAKAILEWSADT